MGQKKKLKVAAPFSSYDSSRAYYIRPYPDHFFLWPVLKQRRLQFTLQDLPNHNKKLVYKSNKPFSLGIGMYLFEVVLELTAAIPLNTQSEELYGESQARDVQLNVFGKQFGVDLVYQRYTQFYVTDPDREIGPGAPYPQRPDILTRNMGITGSYFFNHKKFSFRSAYNYADRQLRSAGSFMLIGTAVGFKVEGDSAIIGDSYSGEFNIDADIRRFKSATYSIAPGYTYSLVHKGFFINGAFALGPGLNWLQHLSENGGEGKYFRVTSFYTGRVALGYSGDRFFGGISLVLQGNSPKFETIQLKTSTGSFKALVGYRFRERGFLKKRLIDLPKALGIGD
ncbi:MAG: DUF4421 family protein [Chryseolinea sp.]